MPETEGDRDGQGQEQEAAEEARLPSYTVTFTGAGIEVVCYGMNRIPLAMVERGQHLAFRQIMVERQKEYQAQRLKETQEKAE